MKFDDFLKYIGEFGPYQRRAYMLICLPLLIITFQIMNPIFIFFSQEHRCAIPGLDNDTYAVQGSSHQAFIDMYIPMEVIHGVSQYSKCEYFDHPAGDVLSDIHTSFDKDANISNFASIGDGLADRKNAPSINVTSSMSNTSLVLFGKKSCNKWVYDRSIFTSTVTSEENLVCNNAIYVAHATTALLVGSTVGIIVMGPVSDRFGRKRTYLSLLLILSVTTIVAVWIPNWIFLICIRFAIGFGFGAFYNAAFVYVLEFVGPTKRTTFGILSGCFWGAGMFLHAGLAFGIRDWKYLQLATGLPYIPFLLLYWWFLPESARWLFVKGRKKDGGKIARTMAKVNHVTVSEEEFSIEADEGIQKQGSILDLFRSKKLFCIFVGALVNWFVCAMTYYGLTLNVSNLGGNLFINYLLTSLVEFLAYPLCIAGLSRVGRKVFHCVCMIFAGVFLLVVVFPEVFQSSASATITTALSLLGKLGLSAAFAVIYLWSAELFPTVIRSTAMSACAFSAAVGAMAAPYIVQLAALLDGDFAQNIPLLFFGGSSIAAGLFALVLPETRNQDLPEDIYDMESLAQSKYEGSHLGNDVAVNSRTTIAIKGLPNTSLNF